MDNSRLLFSIILGALSIAMIVCGYFARIANKRISVSLCSLIYSLSWPIFGNMLVIATSNEIVATAGYYMYFIGMDVIMYTLMEFTLQYCNIKWPSKYLKYFVYGSLAVDSIQILLNVFFHHAFVLEPRMVEGRLYYGFEAFIFQNIHRFIVYAVFISVIVIFIFKMIKAQSVQKERYAYILLTMELVGVWETAYIFSESPIDRSMLGFGVFGLLTFYFAIHYKPVRLLHNMLANVASRRNVGYFCFDLENKCFWANEVAKSLISLNDENIEEANQVLYDKFGDLEVNENSSLAKSIKVNDEARHFVIEKQYVNDNRGRVAGYLLSLRDNTAEYIALEKERYNATHDSLTNLYTKQFLYESVNKLVTADLNNRYLAVFIDINEFKIINDIYGQEFGDNMLVEVANIIESLTPEDAIIGRIGGDKFGVCLLKDEYDEEALIEAISNFKADNGMMKQHIMIHAGVYEIVDPYIEPSIMFDRAHMALASIKTNYHKLVEYYNDEMLNEALWNQHITSELYDALKTNQIVPYIQPIVNEEGKIVGGEALARWIHPEYGFLSPASFVPVFEKNGMIADVDKHMWEQACQILKEWKDNDIDLFLSINISPKDFYLMDVTKELRSLILKYGISPSKLRVEITESIMMNDIENRMNILNNLKRYGFIIEMDDFGSGYSSLNLLKDMPVDLLKIDMMFLKKTKNENKANAIVQNIINLSGDLDIVSLTEGVETPLQYDMLKNMGCKLFQGYYFSKPIPINEFNELYKTKTYS